MMPNEVIKKLRKDKNMSQNELSTILGISQNYLSELERGSKNLSVILAKEFVKVFELDLSIFN